MVLSIKASRQFSGGSKHAYEWWHFKPCITVSAITRILRRQHSYCGISHCCGLYQLLALLLMADQYQKAQNQAAQAAVLLSPQALDLSETAAVSNT